MLLVRVVVCEGRERHGYEVRRAGGGDRGGVPLGFSVEYWVSGACLSCKRNYDMFTKMSMLAKFLNVMNHHILYYYGSCGFL